MLLKKFVVVEVSKLELSEKKTFTTNRNFQQFKQISVSVMSDLTNFRIFELNL